MVRPQAVSYFYIETDLIKAFQLLFGYLGATLLVTLLAHKHVRSWIYELYGEKKPEELANEEQ
jgi:hypothetical protein